MLAACADFLLASRRNRDNRFMHGCEMAGVRRCCCVVVLLAAWPRIAARGWAATISASASRSRSRPRWACRWNWAASRSTCGRCRPWRWTRCRSRAAAADRGAHRGAAGVGGAACSGRLGDRDAVVRNAVLPQQAIAAVAAAFQKAHAGQAKAQPAAARRRRRFAAAAHRARQGDLGRRARASATPSSAQARSTTMACPTTSTCEMTQGRLAGRARPRWSATPTAGT